MNKDILKGRWLQVKGAAKRKWGELTDDDLDKIDGDRMKLAGAVQTKYGIARDKAEKEVAEFCRECEK